MIKIIASIFGSSITQHFKNIFEKFVGALYQMLRRMKIFST